MVDSREWTMTPAQLGALDAHWLGRSQYPDPFLHGSYDEFRIYGEPLTGRVIRASRDAGPDRLATGTAR